MSASFNCHCSERKKPVEERRWEVVDRNQNCSAFNGYRPTYSEYSSVVCRVCGAFGRTKAQYVPLLKDAGPDWASRIDSSYRDDS